MLRLLFNFVVSRNMEGIALPVWVKMSPVANEHNAASLLVLLEHGMLFAKDTNQTYQATFLALFVCFLFAKY